MSKSEKIEELEQRVEQLEEQTVEDQTASTDVSRRRMLQGAGLLGLGGVLGGSAAYSQPAQAEVANGTLKGIGQIGTPDERVGDLYVDNVDSFTESASFESVSTESLANEDGNPDRRFNRIERITSDDINDSTAQIEFDNLSIDKEYRIFYSLFFDNDGTLLIRINGDGDSTGNYGYYDGSSTAQNNQDEFLLYEMNDGTNIGGEVLLTDIRLGLPRQTMINHRAMGPRSAIDDFGREGLRDSGNDGLGSIEIIAEGNGEISDADPIFELWERDYS